MRRLQTIVLQSNDLQTSTRPVTTAQTECIWPSKVTDRKLQQNEFSSPDSVSVGVRRWLGLQLLVNLTL